ncbi:ORF MSV043 putative RNA polymerase largest subunit RPO147 homolog (vaccinia J6R), similar to SW:P20504 [Melanoplus sanguinipes entomopoxvirus]|uniref:DNA-directed RNA polymerase 147 kDa polypeptide n=1 Tax=Melanoplus sanguinipes entomopoxvirus TaxID=83191 RepID=Q9YW50_MSEPV|nr:ORF MSV043 putative RNA polymerase largest subunit RPO147 homolog (vaccinia J6R), similar to SW:P20504 [Melanoplus sanguinipes entomopoxvirus]AAC97832.1 ORF MSV043 putative RNA polymerase largest subunit RPO147 homolog (vaccinia J6R), similar to SW:P20504 [Melanoplus sanguinipes entomopoxvirus 'O']
MAKVNTEILFSMIPNSIIDSIPIIINSISNDADNNVKSTKLGGTKFNVCSTCRLTKDNGDLGHPGRTPLKKMAIIKPAFIKSVLDTLNALKICSNCKMFRDNEALYKILKKYNIDVQDNKIDPPTELKKEILTLIKLNKQSASKCNNINCQLPIATYKYNTIKAQFYIKVIKDKVISNEQIYKMLIGIPHIVYKCIKSPLSIGNFTPYEAFYTNNILIMVNPARPPNHYDNKDSHIMTTKLNQLVGSIIKEKEIEDIQKIYNDIDHVKPKSPYSRGTLFDTLNTEVAGNKKEGILRSYILARRSDNTGRGVAGPIIAKIGYLGIPEIVASTLTESIYYNRFTEQKVRDLIYNSPDVKFIVLYNYEALKPATILEVRPEAKINNLLKIKYGDRIEIPLQNYSMILFSRQPSLHKFNIQCAFCLIHKAQTFSTPTAIANSMNLDYDGDELNIYKPKSPSSIEACFLMLSSAILKNNYNFSPAFGLIQDQLIAIHMLYNIKEISLNDAIYILGEYSYFIRDINKKSYTGVELLSLIFPHNITYNNVIQNGKLILPMIDSRYLVSQSYNALANLMSQLKNNVFGVHLIDILLYIARNVIKLYGFSVSLHDVIPKLNYIEDMYKFVNNCCKIAHYKLLKYYNSNQLNNNNILLSYDELENIRIDNSKIIINEVIKRIGNVFKDDYLNSIITMKNTRYKINDNELATIIGCTGQQGLDSNEIPKPSVMGRIFDFNVPGNIDMESLGFIKSSTLKGLSFAEMCAHAKYNSIKKILKITCETSSAGSTGRKLVKFMEGIKIDHYNRAVLNNYVIWQNPNYYRMIGGDMSRINILLPNNKMHNYNEIMEIYNIIKIYLVGESFTSITKETVFPINIQAEIQSYIIDNDNSQELSNDELINIINEYVEKVKVESFFYTQKMDIFKYVLMTYLDRYTVESYNKKLTSLLVSYIFDKINIKLLCSMSPGYAIGFEYAHTIQEKFTQQALSAFHTSKKSGAVAIQLGFTEFKDTVELSKKNKPDIVIANSLHYKKLEIIKMQLEFVCLKYFDPVITILKEINKDNPYLDINVRINKNYINNKISIYQYINMYNNFLNNCNIISSYWITQNFNDPYIDVIIGVKFKEPTEINSLYFIESLPGAVGKGNFNNKNLKIVPIKMYDFDLNEQDGYSLQFYINSITELSRFDTRDVYIRMNQWFAYELFGIQYAEYVIRNRLVESTNERSMEICYNLLAKLMCETADMVSIKKLRDGKNSIIKHAIHGNQDAIVNAAYNNILDPAKDSYSSLFLNKQPELGASYYKPYLNLNRYDSIKIELKEEEEVNIKSPIIEDF